MLCDNLLFKRIGVVVQHARRSLLQGLLANAMSMVLAYCKAYCSHASQIFFWHRSLSLSV